MPLAARQATSKYNKDVHKTLQKKEEELQRKREARHEAEMRAEKKIPTPKWMGPVSPKVNLRSDGASRKTSPHSKSAPKTVPTVRRRIETSPNPKPEGSKIATANIEPKSSGVKIPCVGEYRLCARAAATETRDLTSEICHLHEAGEIIEVAEVWMSVGGRCRGHGPNGWVSFNNERGVVLLELVEVPIGFGLTQQLWNAFCMKHGIGRGEAVETRLIALAIRELLEGAQPQALGPAYNSVDLKGGTTIERSELERLLLHYIYLSEIWIDLEELHEDRGDKLNLENFTHCCRVLSYPISDHEAAEEFKQLALDVDGRLNFKHTPEQPRGRFPVESLCFHSWIAHRATAKQSLGPHDDTGTVESSATHSKQGKQSNDANTSAPSSVDQEDSHTDKAEVLQRAMQLSEVLQVGSTEDAVGTARTTSAPSNMPPIPSAARMERVPRVEKADVSEPVDNGALTPAGGDESGTELPTFNMKHGAALHGHPLFRVNKQKAEDSSDNAYSVLSSGRLHSPSHEIDHATNVSGDSLEDLYLASQPQLDDGNEGMDDGLDELHTLFRGTAPADSHVSLRSRVPEKGSTGHCKLLVEQGDLVKHKVSKSASACLEESRTIVQ